MPKSFERVNLMPKEETRAPFVWDKDNLRLRKVNLSRSKTMEGSEQSSTAKPMEWRKAIEARIKSTSEKVKAAANNAKSPSVRDPGSNEVNPPPPPPPPPPNPASFTPNPTSTSKYSNYRPKSPFQANRNSFLSRRNDPTAASATLSGNNSNIAHGGIPRTIEKKPLDDDAISGCSSSIADRIKAFENTGSDSHSKPRMFGRSAPLNSYALSRLRNVTSNVGGLWS